MSRRVPAAALVALATLGGALVPQRAHAQTTRAWNVCFTSRIASCTELSLTTTPTLDVSRARTGTLVDLLVRQQQGGGVVSGIQDDTIYFTAAGTGSGEGPLALTPLAGAPALPAGAALQWSGGGQSTDGAPPDPLVNSFGFGTSPDAQLIGGCLGATFDATHQSPLSTCGAQAYRFSVASGAWLDADAVVRLQLDLYAGDGNGDTLADVAFCSAFADGAADFGYDYGDFHSGDVCRATPLATTAPEPAPAPLLAAALALLAGVATLTRRTRGDAACAR